MKLHLILAFVSCLFLRVTQAQGPTDKYQFFDERWKPTKEKKAVYLVRIRHFPDICWQYSYYNMYGPLVRIESFLDEKATVRHGLFAWYAASGEVDSIGYYDHDIRDGDWFFSNPKVYAYFEKGRMLGKKEQEAKLASFSIPDPNFPDVTRESPESYFPGGQQGWFQFLNTHLRYPDRAINNEIRGKVILSFIVEPTGKLSHFQIQQSVEISLDDEALRLMDQSPDWIPAIKLDVKVRSYKKQPIVFQLTIEKRK